MRTITQMLCAHSQISDYKINIHQKQTYELFFVKGKLETVRCTDTCDKEVTVYVDHGEFKGDAQFFVYPSTTPDQLSSLINEAVAKALLINNRTYALPEASTGEFSVPSNFSEYAPEELACMISQAVFAANTLENASLNSVEVFVNKHIKTVVNSKGLHKTQTSYDAMVEAIPTFNGAQQSVELYEQYNFSTASVPAITAEIAQRLIEVKARYEAQKPVGALSCPVIFNVQELAELFGTIASDLNYGSVYAHANLFKKGDAIQSAPTGDRISITMAGAVEGNIRSAAFDVDGLSLDRAQLVKDGVAVGYYGSNRFGQYLSETPTGNLGCLLVDAGKEHSDSWMALPHLEILSMSGLQVDMNNDYIGGEIRLAWYFDGTTRIPVTGISVSGSLKAVLNSIKLSENTGIHNGYMGPAKALIPEMNIF